MPELVAIWIAGLVLLVVLFGLVAALLRFTPSGRAQEMSRRDVFTVLVIVVALSCAVFSLLALVS